MALLGARDRVETSIAAGRVLLAVFALAAIWLEPFEPTRAPLSAYALLTGYAAYSVALLADIRRRFTPSRWWVVATHVVDLAAFTIVLQFTDGTSSPFFAYFLFPLAVATLRWQWRGALWTGAAALAAFSGIALHALAAGNATGGELRIVLSRLLSLALATAMLWYLGLSHARGRQHQQQLAALQDGAIADPVSLAPRLLEGAAVVFPGARLLLAWEDSEEPWTTVATLARGHFSWNQDQPGLLERAVIPSLHARAFFCADIRLEPSQVVVLRDGEITWQRGTPITDGFASRFGVRAIASWPAVSGEVKARLCCLDDPYLGPDDLKRGQAVAQVIGARLAQAVLLQQAEHGFSGTRRHALARDLHDGVLQSLTAAALQLQAARRLLGSEPAVAAARLEELQGILTTEHSNMRALIEELQPGRAHDVTGEVGVSGLLQDLVARLGREWRCRVSLALEPERLRLPREAALDVYMLTNEAVVNAARHARATHVSVALLQAADRLVIAVSDDGKGFGFEGAMDLDDPRMEAFGPSTLRGRVLALQGTLRVQSSARGSRVEVELPLAAAGASA